MVFALVPDDGGAESAVVWDFLLFCLFGAILGVDLRTERCKAGTFFL